MPHQDKTFSVIHLTPGGESKYPGLIVIHEVWGLTGHIKEVASRFSKRGYDVIAPDLLSDTGITEKIDQSIMKEVANPATRDEAQKKLREAMAPLQSPEFANETVTKLKQCIDYLLDDESCTGKVGVVGYCFGGTYAYALATADDRLKAAVPYYGHADNLAEIQNISCPILAFYGEEDDRLVKGLPDLRRAMQENNKDFEAIVYADAGHAFFNDTNPVTYRKKAAEDAWEKTISFLSDNLT